MTQIAGSSGREEGLRKQINETARKERNARLYFRGGELTNHLQDKAEMLTDEDIKQFLTYVFSFTRKPSGYCTSLVCPIRLTASCCGQRRYSLRTKLKHCVQMWMLCRLNWTS